MEMMTQGITDLGIYAKSKKRPSVRERVIRFFTEHPNPKDEEVHRWAKSQN